MVMAISFVRRFAQISLLLSLCQLSFVLADPPAFEQSDDFETGKLGIYPELKFISTDLRAPQLNFLKWGDECKTAEFFFICPRGLLVGPAGPVILNGEGHMIWHREDFGVAYGLDVQQYKGDHVLTFWAGDDSVVGHGSGFYYMFDSAYRQMYKVGALHNVTADLHEFKITRDSTALFTSYEKIEADLSYFEGHEQGFIFDCIFQEINIETNELLFEWRATEHFGLEDCYNDLRDDAGVESNPFDYYHINSVDKDDKGNYIVSARYSHAVTYIDGRTGATLWHLGGKNNSFTDLSNGSATDFKWQHDARWHDDYTAISIFDNAAYFGDDGHPARGMKVSIDTKAMTAELVNEWIHPEKYVSESQGSMQMLDNGNAFLGYGSAAAYAEFSSDGKMLCDVHFGALHFDENKPFSPGAVMSYRAYKHAWVGRPAEVPKAKFKDGTFYVSWNGATEVRWWLLESNNGSVSQSNSRPWEIVGMFAWSGFESELHVPTGPIDAGAHLVYRLSALDGNDELLGTWTVSGDGVVQPLLAPQRSFSPALRVVEIAALVTVLALVLFSRRGINLCARVNSCLSSRKSYESRTISRRMSSEERTSRDLPIAWADDRENVERVGLIRNRSPLGKRGVAENGVILIKPE